MAPSPPTKNYAQLRTTSHDYTQLSTMVDFIVLSIKLVFMVLGVSYSQVLAQRDSDPRVAAQLVVTILNIYHCHIVTVVNMNDYHIVIVVNKYNSHIVTVVNKYNCHIVTVVNRKL